MGYVESERNKAVAAVTPDGDWIALNSGVPDASGANLLSGPRVQTTWGTPIGAISTGTDCEMAVAAGEDPTHASVWDAQTGGNFVGGAALSNAPGKYTSNGTYTVTPKSTCPAS